MAVLPVLPLPKPRKKIAQRQLDLRSRLWPTHHDGHIWQRKHHNGFATIPRTMPLIMTIMDDLSDGRPVASTYIDLWCRAFDECFVTLSKPREMAFHAGFTGQRGERTWRERMRILHDLGFIDIKEGPSGPMSYALILNPYLVIRRLMLAKHPGVRGDKYNALMERAGEIGALDLEMPDPWTTSAPAVTTAAPAVAALTATAAE
ncbi:hypothetical protein [Bradyrhizobium sp. 35]|uniref:hypothetical protein n=1 Tax=Bradyrhizobium sp. 35 TaxID=2782670 RepID=UPI001FFB3203|nr:hypothetical protein [Bradyrhizobium sp. 35]